MTLQVQMMRFCILSLLLQNEYPFTVLLSLCTELFTNPLPFPYNDDQLDFTIPNNNNLLWFCAFCKDKNLLRDTPRSVMFINNVDCRRVLWDSQQIAVGFDVITGETRGKCTNVLDRGGTKQ